MKEKQLYKKWFSNPKYYNPEVIRQMQTEEGHTCDIAIVYSGRNRGKSFNISAPLIAEAWYSDGERQFGYIRRYDKEMKNYAVEKYFDDKIQFIVDLTDGACDCVLCEKGDIWLAKTEKQGNKATKNKVLQIGSVFALSMATQYKSLQFPKIHSMILEEVFTIDGYLPNETDKLLSIISTVKRNKPDFIVYLISNLVSKINPYTQGFSLKRVLKQKPGTIDEYRLYMGSYDERGIEEYLYICVEYLQDLDNELTNKEKLKDGKDRLRASITSNKWEEAYIYPTISAATMKDFETLYTCVFEYNEFKFMCEIKSVPINLQYAYNHLIETDEELEYNTQTMHVCFVQRKTSKTLDTTRLYTTNPIVAPMCTRGYYLLNDLDQEVDKLIDIGHCFFADNLTGNEFKQALDDIKSYNF